ncbi:MAG: alpha/beta fold hydrolase [Deltaproteobacteria bacterium]|nr:MAG: alpha/beta fold hydrolase [Deltaproteobacteria bacterium]
MGALTRSVGRARHLRRVARHTVAYARHLVRGNAIAGDVSWTSPGAVPVVLAHGFLGTRGSMQMLARRLRRDGRVVVSYSHGTFQIRSLRASAQELADHLARLQDELRVERFDVVGFSMGGLTALHAVKFLALHRLVRRLVLLGSPVDGTPAGYLGVATLGWMSPSVWQVLPGSPFLRELREAPLPTPLPIRQIHAAQDVLCPLPAPVEGVRKEDFVVLPGGHSSLVVARPFYLKVREFLNPEVEAAQSGPRSIPPPFPEASELVGS